MDFYTAIAEYYDEIFPLNPEVTALVRNILEECPVTGPVLDIGCATGELSLALADLGFEVTGIDFDHSMIGLAQKKLAACFARKRPRFYQMDMGLLDRHFAPGSFQLACCFGNTLVHLPGPRELRQALGAAAAVLAGGGTYAVQILHYDYILDHKITALPLINHERFTFERYYRFEDNLVYFDTILRLKAEKKELTNSIVLYPIRKDELAALIKEAGFEPPGYYGTFKQGPLAADSLVLVATARKK